MKASSASIRALWCCISGLVLFSALVVRYSGQASAALIYDNGPVAGQLAYNIGHFFVSDSFTVSSPTTLTSAQVELSVITAKIPVSANWEIGITSGGDEVASGFANFKSTPITQLGLGFYASTFALSVNLNSAGTYYLTFLNGVASDGDDLFWVANGGPSTAYQNGGNGTISSESFQIYGEAAPETSSFGAGVLLLLMMVIAAIMNRVNGNMPPDRAPEP